ncbi:MAG TPA: hypothetical protein VG222_01835 [Vicinamibacterales bacterium]|jgi:hypothetical protein|nr:hypothetical protein [Vicinamibacterales bacterium]
MHHQPVRVSVLCIVCLLAARLVRASQNETPPPPASGDAAPTWTTSVDGQLFATFNRQGGSRGDTEFRSQNWFMGMAGRPLPVGTLTLSGMITAEPLTVGLAGYSEILQEGEAYHGLQITDHQHPHDLLMQLAAAWRAPLSDRTTFTLAGSPVGEAALGPVAFMHRASSAENPTAPLSHHIFDSTHMVTGVVLGRVDRGPLSVEGSIFRGREPDEDRYDVDLGALDSWSTRVWLRPNPAWTIQASYGFLHAPEQLEPGDQRRTNASASWFRQRGSNYSAITAAVGWNARQYSTVHAVLVEGTQHFGRTSIYGRFEDLTVETEILLFPEQVHRPHPGELVDPVQAFTAGTVRDVAAAKGLSFGVGGDVTFYQLPPLLQITHEPHPVSFHVFLRIARSSLNDRMWNTTMAGHGAGHDGMMAHHHPD